MKQIAEQKLKLFLENSKPTNPKKWRYWVNQAKKKFDKYPSAYANGWAARQYKKSGGGWRKSANEELNPAILDISKEWERYKKHDFDEPNFSDSEYYTGM